MARRVRETDFSQPVRQIFLMLVALGATGVIGWMLLSQIETVFYANPWLNGLILGVFALGVLAAFTSVLRLVSAVRWIERFAADRAAPAAQPPALLVSLAPLLRDRQSRRALSAASARTILDSIASRLDESRDVTRYIGSLCIFLGLLGTFWGLSITVPAVVDTIRSLAPDAEGGAAATFDNLMSGLESQLGGMGTAFASSLLGLAGSLVIGLLELFASHGQNRFHNELEEWLSTFTRVSAGDGEQVTPELIADLLGQNAEQMESFAEIMRHNEERRAAFEDRMQALTEQISRLASSSASTLSTEAATRAERQIAAMDRLADRLEADAEGDGPMGDAAEVRGRLRSIDRHLARLLEDSAVGREQAVADLRGDLGRLSGAIARLADAAER